MRQHRRDLHTNWHHVYSALMEYLHAAPSNLSPVMTCTIESFRRTTAASVIFTSIQQCGNPNRVYWGMTGRLLRNQASSARIKDGTFERNCHDDILYSSTRMLHWNDWRAEIKLGSPRLTGADVIVHYVCFVFRV